GFGRERSLGIDPDRGVAKAGWAERVVRVAWLTRKVDIAAADGRELLAGPERIVPHAHGNGVQGVPPAVPDFDGVESRDLRVRPVGAVGPGMVLRHESAILASGGDRGLDSFRSWIA